MKWVGFFGVALVGLHTIRDLWLGLPIKTTWHMIKDLSARTLCLILLPVLVYTASFYAHFTILNHSGPGDAQMSSLFQAGLKNNEISKSPFEIAFGSTVTLRNQVNGGGLLHSHVQTYPEGSLQQQVTGYHHKDVNNDFIIKKSHEHSHEVPEEGAENPIEFIKDGDIIRLVHKATGRNLHSHRVLAHMTKIDFEVSAYGNDTALFDPNDHWKIEIVSDFTKVSNPENRIRSLGTSFRLQHVATGCYLASGKTNYPDWGFKQQEVSCQRELSSSSNLLWNVETHVNENLPEGEPGLYKSSFWKDLVDVNINMWRTNNALVPDAELEPSALTSSAWEWPFLLTGIRMTSFDDNTVKFYMGGNPFIWWPTGIAIFLAAFSLVIYALCEKRQLPFPLATSSDAFNVYTEQISISVTGWFLHYFPFFVMGRVLYLHHYYPALFFAILTFASLFDRAVFRSNTRHLWSRKSYIAMLAVSVPVIAIFYVFMPICYGIHGPIANYSHLQWVSSWKLGVKYE